MAEDSKPDKQNPHSPQIGQTAAPPPTSPGGPKRQVASKKIVHRRLPIKRKISARRKPGAATLGSSSAKRTPVTPGVSAAASANETKRLAAHPRTAAETRQVHTPAPGETASATPNPDIIQRAVPVAAGANLHPRPAKSSHKKSASKAGLWPWLLLLVAIGIGAYLIDRAEDEAPPEFTRATQTTFPEGVPPPPAMIPDEEARGGAAPGAGQPSSAGRGTEETPSGLPDSLFSTESDFFASPGDAPSAAQTESAGASGTEPVQGVWGNNTGISQDGGAPAGYSTPPDPGALHSNIIPQQGDIPQDTSAAPSEMPSTPLSEALEPPANQLYPADNLGTSPAGSIPDPTAGGYPSGTAGPQGGITPPFWGTQPPYFGPPAGQGAPLAGRYKAQPPYFVPRRDRGYYTHPLNRNQPPAPYHYGYNR